MTARNTFILAVALDCGARGCSSRHRHLRYPRRDHAHGHRDRRRLRQPALLDLLRCRRIRRESHEISLRDALGNGAPALGLESGDVQAGRAGDVQGITRSPRSDLLLLEHHRVRGRQRGIDTGSFRRRRCTSCAERRRRPTGEPNITGDWAPEQLVMTDPRGRGGALVPLSR